MNPSTLTEQRLALQGGPKAVPEDEPDLFHWPIVTEEDEQAILQVLHDASMSQSNITMEFEKAWGEYLGTEYNLGHPNGTAALLSAMFGVELGRGDEMISPSMTYWASALQTYSLGATPVFADVDPDTLCIDPGDIEHRITDRTRAIMVVHYAGHPCDMDPIMAIARAHRVKVIEDCSHAHGTLYKGRMVGSIGDVAGMSMMSRKSFAIGEAGMLCTNDRSVYERAAAFGHYERTRQVLTRPELVPFAGMPLGGVKHRMNQWCAALGLVQLKYYAQRIKVIQRAVNRFWDRLEGVPGLRAHRVPEDSTSTMGGWYAALGHYVPEELGGLAVAKFIEAVNAEGGRAKPSGNAPMHVHPVLREADIYGDGKPTRLAFSARDVREGDSSLPVTESLTGRMIGVPHFKHDRVESIERYASAWRKVAVQADKLCQA